MTKIIINKDFKAAPPPYRTSGAGFASLGLAAFTLAEILITLAIIGVVAAMTIPTLIAHNQQRGWDTGAKVFERRLDEALKIMDTQQNLTGYRTTEEFVSELSKHMKVIKSCNTDNLMSCFENTVTWGDNEIDITNLKTSRNLGHKEYGTNVVGIVLANGTNALVAYNPKCISAIHSFQDGVDVKNCVSVLYDTTGYKKPNTLAKDLRQINVAGIMGLDCVEIDGINGCFKMAQSIDMSLDCSDTGKNSPIPEVRDDYNKYCIGKQYGASGFKDDNWAMANKICGGQDNLPTLEQLEAILSDIYGNPRNYNGQKAAYLGLPSAITSGEFYIWTQNEIDHQNVIKLNCGGGHFGRTPATRRGAGRYVICMGK